MIDLYLLRYFLAVVETGTFTRAADKCFVAQPTLSAGIKKLEAQVGQQLFERSNKRVFLTDAGARFLPRAKAIFHECNIAVMEMKEAGSRPLLRLGILTTIPSSLVRQIITGVRGQMPDIAFEVEDGSEQELRNRLDERAIDFAIALERGPVEEDRMSLLMEEDYVFVLPDGAGHASGTEIKVSDLDDCPMVVRSRCEVLSETSRYFTDRNIRPRLVYRTANDIRALEMVAAGIGGTIVPRSLTRLSDGISWHPLRGFNYSRKVVLYHPRNSLSGNSARAAEALISYTGSYYGKNAF